MRPWQVGGDRGRGSNESRYSAPSAVDTPLLWLLAALSFGAGVIHLYMVPNHVEESLQLGVAFAMAGWFQIAAGIAMLVRPSRGWLFATVGANVVFIAIWTLSRTEGLPSWMGGEGKESIAAADAATVAFEAALVLTTLAILASRLLAKAHRSGFTVAAVIPVCVLVATSTVLALPSTHEHGHHHHGVAAAHDHTHGAAGHDHSAQSASAGGHVHHESTTTYAELPKKTKAEVDHVIALYVGKYPTAGAAAADGWYRVTKSLYGIGAHYIRTPADAIPAFDLGRPDILLFDGDGPDAKFAGVSYSLPYEPEGFTGPDDVWHNHAAACVAGGTTVSLIEDGSPVWLTKDQCLARGGRVSETGDAWMLHVWIGPGYIDDAPIFAHDNPDLYDGYNPQQDSAAAAASSAPTASVS